MFFSERMVEGYTRHRPAVHPHIVARIAERIGIRERALDLGCGTGLSTAPLKELAGTVVGLEPVVSMLRRSSEVAPGAHFLAGKAEELPIRSASIDVMTAAGSLDYADLALLVPEALRVLRPDGVVVVYDFGPGCEFSDSNALATWFVEFQRRWPAPASGKVDVTRPPLNGAGLRLEVREDFAIPLLLGEEFYCDYVLTETSVETAIRNGESEAEIRRWCAETLAGVFGGRERVVLFRGYLAYLSRQGSE